MLGPFCSISLCVHKQSRRQCAVKIISNAVLEDQRIVGAVLAEQRIMREVSHYPFLLGLLASFRGVHGLYLISEYCCSTLFDGRFHMPESYKKLASAELACAVNHLHNLGIVHRDIKLENVMVKNDGHVVLGDFDLAVCLETANSPSPRPTGSLPGGKGNAVQTRGVCGTLPYMAPEVLRNMEYSYGVDWFSYGVFLHVFYLDKFPWLGEYEHPVSYLKEMMSTISHGVIFRDGMFGDLLKKLFCVDQHDRADFSVVRRAPFFADFDWQKLFPMNSTASASCLSDRPRHWKFSDRPTIGEFPVSIDSDPYSEFTWLSLPMIVEEAAPDVGGAPEPESAIAKYHTPSDFDAPSSGRSPVSCGSSQLSILSLYCIYLGIHLATCTRMTMFYETQCGLSTKEKTRFSASLRRGPPPSETSIPASVRLLKTLQPVKTMKPFCARLSGHWTLEKSLCSSCRRDGRKHLFPRLTSPYLFIAATGIHEKTSVLPKIKSLWKRATSKFTSRRV
ncbi:kinase-like domain-containing protein [Russula aff. rugulosa BPL654]|nr:kinase-like domain-containing protein [Russula aff. rugulosa BPL654]